jgi:hypothetical protein
MGEKQLVRQSVYHCQCFAVLVSGDWNCPVMAHRPSHALYQTGILFSFLFAKVVIKEQNNCLQNAPKHAKSNIDFNIFPGGDTPGFFLRDGDGKQERWRR